ncbi:MAG: hypothetical protein NTU41_10365, partial [Chloroflexi bacterium]|nr:hypothetical protein [Chloroflexota bacterium]
SLPRWREKCVLTGNACRRLGSEKGASRMAEELNSKMSEQLQAVVERARELFVDLLEEQAGNGKLRIGPMSEPDKRTIERLFSEVVYSRIVAEAAAILSLLSYTQTEDDGMLSKIAPSFLDRCESRAELTGDSLAGKVSGLAALATAVRESGKPKTAAVSCLLDDLVRLPQPGPLRASFDAVALSLLGE